MRRVTFGSHTTLAASGVSATTNDLGEFRLFNLPPGEYYVLATYSRPPGYGPCPAIRLCQHVLSWFAGASWRASSVVRAGRDSERVNFTLARCRLARALDNPRQFTRRPARPGHLDVPHQARRRLFALIHTSDEPPGRWSLPVRWHSTRRLLPRGDAGRADEGRSLCQRLDRRSGRVAACSNEHRREGVGPRCRRWPCLPARDPHMSLRIPRRGCSAPTLRWCRRLGAGKRPLRVGRASRTDGAFRGRLPEAPFCRFAAAGRSSPGRRWCLTGTERFDDVVVELTKRVAQVDVNVTSASEGGRARTRYGDPLLRRIRRGGITVSSKYDEHDRLTPCLPGKYSGLPGRADRNASRTLPR